MTLHWWMHWFWVTTLLVLNSSSGTGLALPQSETVPHQTDVQTARPSERQGRAMYFSKSPQMSTTTLPIVENQTQPSQQNATSNITSPSQTIINNTEIAHPSLDWTPVNISDHKNATEAVQINDTTTITPTYANVPENNNGTFTKRRNLTRPDYVKDETSIEGIAESRIVTERPLSLETALLQTRIPPNIESSRRIIDQPPENKMDTGAIAGISFAALVLTALAGSTGFVLYRRRYLNNPQTLNDKCSNPDSSGYLDDSTIRDNSEEMYSLDNDSFLNSLEAMTIQNYWTDTVKHTKL